MEEFKDFNIDAAFSAANPNKEAIASVMECLHSNKPSQLRGILGKMTAVEIGMCATYAELLKGNDAKTALQIEYAKRLSASNGWRHSTPEMGEEKKHAAYISSTPEGTFGIEFGYASKGRGEIRQETGIGLYLRCEHLAPIDAPDRTNGQPG